MRGTDGDAMRYINGQHHREDGPAVEWATEDTQWYLNGNHRRIGGPAIECVDDSKEWFTNGKHHRVDGPAVEPAPGRGESEWFLHGVRICLKLNMLVVRNLHRK